MLKRYAIIAVTTLFCFVHLTQAQAEPCPFDNTKTCTLVRNILNDKTTAGLKYYAATNYDHRVTGEINIYDATLVQSYQDSSNTPGQIKLIANKINSGFYKSGEIMTRSNLDKPPYSSPTKSAPWTTKEITQGYLEIVAKMPKCESSDDGLCQRNANPADYNNGLWPSIWLLPSNDANWPANGEINLGEAYPKKSCFNMSAATLRFNGTDTRCVNSDCKTQGYRLGYANVANFLYDGFHKWGFQWQPDPNNSGQVLLTGYFDNLKIWGPLSTASLPADGPNAFKRGFGDPIGGYYIIANLAIGGPFAGTPNSHLQTASLYIQSIKAYNISGNTPPGKCLPPANIRSSYTADKKQITLTWDQPSNSSVILNYQINDWLNRLMWKGSNNSQRTFIDKTLPGTPGTFTYFLYSNCAAGLSTGVKYDVKIN